MRTPIVVSPSAVARIGDTASDREKRITSGRKAPSMVRRYFRDRPKTEGGGSIDDDRATALSEAIHARQSARTAAREAQAGPVQLGRLRAGVHLSPEAPPTASGSHAIAHPPPNRRGLRPDAAGPLLRLTGFAGAASRSPWQGISAAFPRSAQVIHKAFDPAG